jgi:hypothetical protein
MQPRIDQDYLPEITEASKSVLLETMTVLGEYRDSIVLIGGWAPYFLLKENPVPASSGEDAPFSHVGSIDIDLAVDPGEITGEEYKTIVRLLLDRDYKPHQELKYRLNRFLPGLAEPIGVDFLTTQPPVGQGRSHRHRNVQDNLPARATAFLEMAFQWNQPLKIKGELPQNGGLASVDLKLAALPAMFGLKGLALGSRYKEKDAYDVYAMARYYGRGIQTVIDLLKPHVGDAGLKKGLAHIREKFKHDKDAGPAWVANFFSEADEETRAGIMQDSFQALDRVLGGCRL